MLRARYNRYFSLPSASFQLSELASLCHVIEGLFPNARPDKLDITFRSVVRQTLTADSADDISADDAFVPDTIVDPAIVAVKLDNRGDLANAIHLEKGGFGYKMELECADPSWLVHSEKIAAWLRMHRTWYSARVSVIIPSILFACVSLVSAFLSGHTDPHNANRGIIDNPYMFILGVVGTAFGIIFAMLQDTWLPHIAVVVRPRPKRLTLGLVLGIVTALGVLVNVLYDIKAMLHR